MIKGPEELSYMEEGDAYDDGDGDAMMSQETPRPKVTIVDLGEAFYESEEGDEGRIDATPDVHTSRPLGHDPDAVIRDHARELPEGFLEDQLEVFKGRYGEDLRGADPSTIRGLWDSYMIGKAAEEVLEEETRTPYDMGEGDGTLQVTSSQRESWDPDGGINIARMYDLFNFMYPDRWKRTGGYWFSRAILKGEELPSRMEKEGPDTQRMMLGNYMQPLIIEKMRQSGMRVSLVASMVPRDYKFIEDSPDGMVHGLLPYSIPMEIKVWERNPGRTIPLADLMQCIYHCLVTNKTYCLYYRFSRDGNSHFMALVRRHETLSSLCIEASKSSYERQVVDRRSIASRAVEAHSTIKVAFHTIFEYSVTESREVIARVNENNPKILSWSQDKVTDFMKRMVN